MAAPCHVVVISDQSLVADAVSAALASPGLVVTRGPWRSLAGVRVPASRVGEPYDVGVLLSDLQPLLRMVEAQTVVQDMPLPWLVLTGARKGPLWGAMLEAGAVAVQRSSASLNELRTAILGIAAGEPLMPRLEAATLKQEWHEVEEEQRRAVEKVRSLSPRESEVLHLMHAGESVSGIAVRFGVREATVRSQVRAVLRKLDVRSQLAAAAAFDAASREIDDPEGTDQRSGRP
jgi:DNA-binding NarL/FixJ family response regulator